MKITLYFLIFGFSFLIAGCDKGRVINENERRNVIFGDGNQKTEFGSRLEIIPNYFNPSNPQSEYFFWIFEPKSAAYHPLNIASLLRLDQNRAPKLTIGASDLEMRCLEFRSDKCFGWAAQFDLADHINGSPPIAFEIRLFEGLNFSLSKRTESGLVPLADYKTFILHVIWPDRQITFPLAKQNFFTTSDLERVPFGFGNSVFESLFQAGFFWPVFGYNLKYQTVTGVKTTEKRLDLDIVFANVETDGTEKFQYSFELR